MKAKFFALPAVVAVLTACSSVNQDRFDGPLCSVPSDLTQLSGSYIGEGKGVNRLGPTIGSSKLDLKVDKNGVIAGWRSWQSRNSYGFTNDGAKTKQDRERVVGIIDAGDCQIGLAETAERGALRGRLVSGGGIQLMLIESGDQYVVKSERYNKVGQ